MSQTAKHEIEDLPSLRLPELQAYYAEVVGEPTRCPNKKFLVRRIVETLAEQSENAANEERAQSEGTPVTETAKPEMADTKESAPDIEANSKRKVEGTENEVVKPLTKLSIDELKQRYLKVVGRPTGSSHRRYLIWKIRQAENGKISVGPRKQRDPNEPAPEFKVLPLRMEASVVEQLDQARERLGLQNRMDLFRKALSAYFTSQGEVEVAALFRA